MTTQHQAAHDTNWEPNEGMVVGFAAGLSPRHLINGFQPRHFFRRAVDGYLPDKIMNKSKHGFGLPFAHWLKSTPRLQDLAYESLETVKDRGFIRADYVETLVEQQRRSSHPGYAGPVWDLMLLEYWFRSHVDGRAKIMEEQVV